MLTFVQSWFAAGANPIGIDFGTECLRMAQVEKAGGDCRLIAAASLDVPTDIRTDPTARLDFFAAKLPELCAQGNFRGRRVVLAVPAANMHVQHLRLPRMDEESIKKALPWESSDKLPFDPSDAMLRHLVAGDIYCEQEPRSEVILMAAQRHFIDAMLAAAGRGRVDVVGMNVEPVALIDCFLNIYRRKSDADQTNCFVDIGSRASRAIIARGGQVLFVRNLPIGGEHFNGAVATELSITAEEARARRARPSIDGETLTAGHATSRNIERRGDGMGAAPANADEDSQSSAMQCEEPIVSSFSFLAGEDSWSNTRGNVAVARARPSPAAAAASLEQQRIERALREPVARLVEELSLCRRYHEATFPDRPIQRLIFVGGEAQQRDLCQQIARALGIGAQIGDPLVRMGRTTQVGIESGIDRRQPQPAWAVAIGLSMGPVENNAT
ncbi:MAG TPA: pilus assembly protein PilM [Tepidisphaeraceae bacterium]|jgi:type IV pilus assembly protein PilM|nr:pilus assembly protein PilM [Tepidisphaeraceae bacterium]